MKYALILIILIVAAIDEPAHALELELGAGYDVAYSKETDFLIASDRAFARASLPVTSYVSLIATYSRSIEYWREDDGYFFAGASVRFKFFGSAK